MVPALHRGLEAGQTTEALVGPWERGAWRQDIGTLENQRKENKSRGVQGRERSLRVGESSQKEASCRVPPCPMATQSTLSARAD